MKVLNISTYHTYYIITTPNGFSVYKFIGLFENRNDNKIGYYIR